VRFVGTEERCSPTRTAIPSPAPCRSRARSRSRSMSPMTSATSWSRRDSSSGRRA